MCHTFTDCTVQTEDSGCKRPVCALIQHYMYLWFVVKKRGRNWEKVRLQCFHANPQPKQRVWVELMIYWWRAWMHNKAPPFTHPDDDSVVSLEFGEKQVSSQNLRLVQGAKATQHFYVALRWDIGHCADSRRRKDAAVCWEERCCWARGDQSMIGAWSYRQNKRRAVRSDFVRLCRGLWGRYAVLFWRAETGCSLFMRSWMVFSCRSEAC